MGSASDIVWALRTAVSPDVLASVQGLVYIQSLSLYPKISQAKGSRRVVSYGKVVSRWHQGSSDQVAPSLPSEFPQSLPLPFKDYFRTESCYVAQAGLEHALILPNPPQC